MRRAIVLDCDGVILNTSHIFKELYELDLEGNAKWDYFHEHCNSDKVELMPGIRKFFSTLYNDVPLAIIVSTARNEKVRQQTVAKLLKHGIITDHLYMRKNEDYRPSSEIKKEHLQEIMSRYDVVAFIDDDIENCQMAKELGILTLRRV